MTASGVTDGGSRREFNTTGLCMPGMHYMVDISGRVEKMRAMVDAGEYFCVNRARQYGKTTAFASLEDVLASDYVVAVRTFRPYRTQAFVRRALSCGPSAACPFAGMACLPCRCRQKKSSKRSSAEAWITSPSTPLSSRFLGGAWRARGLSSSS